MPSAPRYSPGRGIRRHAHREVDVARLARCSVISGVDTTIQRPVACGRRYGVSYAAPVASLVYPSIPSTCTSIAWSLSLCRTHRLRDRCTRPQVQHVVVRMRRQVRARRRHRRHDIGALGRRARWRRSQRPPPSPSATSAAATTATAPVDLAPFRTTPTPPGVARFRLRGVGPVARPGRASSSFLLYRPGSPRFQALAAAYGPSTVWIVAALGVGAGVGRDRNRQLEDPGRHEVRALTVRRRGGDDLLSGVEPAGRAWPTTPVMLGRRGRGHHGRRHRDVRRQDRVAAAVREVRNREQYVPTVARARCVDDRERRRPSSW